MRSILRTALAAVMALLAIGTAGMSSAAAAAPEFAGPFPNKIIVKNQSELAMFSEGSVETACSNASGAKGEGTVTGPKELTIKLTYTGCLEHAFGTKSCSNIVTEELKASPVYIAKATKQVGLLLNSPANPTKPPTFAKYKCNSEGSEWTETVRGSVIAPFGATSINKTAKLFGLSFTRQLSNQKPSQYETEAGKFEHVYLEQTHLGTKSFELTALGRKNELPSSWEIEAQFETELKA